MKKVVIQEIVMNVLRVVVDHNIIQYLTQNFFYFDNNHKNLNLTNINIKYD